MSVFADVPPQPTAHRTQSVAVCAALLIIFALLSYSAALTKSATYDEPFYWLGSWIKLHQGDFRMDFESPPLPCYWAALPNSATALQFNAHDENWKHIIDEPYRGWTFVIDTLYRTPGNDGGAMINRSRFMMMLLGVGLGAMIIATAWKFGGATAGIAAGVLFAFDPNLIGHASLVKNDLIVTLTMAAAILATYYAGRQLTLINLLLLSVTVALAQNEKFSAIILVPIVALLLMIRALLPATWTVFGKTLTYRRQRFAAVMLCLLVISIMSFASIWACYRFRFAASPDPAIAIDTEGFRRKLLLDRFEAEHPLPPPPAPNQSRDSFVQAVDSFERLMDGVEPASRQSSFPPDLQSYVNEVIDRATKTRTDARNVINTRLDSRIDEVRRAIWQSEQELRMVEYFTAHPKGVPDFFMSAGEFLLDHRIMPAAWTNGLLALYVRAEHHPGYLLGKVIETGTWLYFPLAFAFKTPIAELLALLGALAVGINWIFPKRCWRQDQVWLFVCFVVPVSVYMTIVMRSNLDIGLRYLFPVYPYMFIAAGVAIASALRLWPKPAKMTAIMLGVMLATETLLAWPNYIAHFNFIARPYRLHLLSDSNLDWGQDLPALAKWQRDHGNVPIALAYFGTVEPAFYGIRYIPAPPWPPSREAVATQVIAITATQLQGAYGNEYVGYQQWEPSDVVGDTIYIYDLRTVR